MKKQQIVSITSTVGLAITTMLSAHAAVAQEVATQGTSGTPSPMLTAQLSARVGFVPPAEDGAPRHTRGGATRDPSCDAVQVLPEGARGLTVSARPVIPAYFQAGVKQVWLKIEAVDGSEEYSYELDRYFALPEGKGFAEVPLPDSVGELTLNKQYVWSLVLICNNPLGPSSPVVKGSIRRVPTSWETAEIEQMSFLEKAELYGKEGLWYDFIYALNQVRMSAPNNMQAAYDWETALSTQALDFALDEQLTEQ